ncbi:MAG: hypothetical protein HY332_10025 [Chloroflexi bacterium]|nr:hypothetical protein [Chloroflexota bacterium]
MTATTNRVGGAASAPATDSVPEIVPSRPIELADGWAGDLAWCDGAVWVAWAVCSDPEPELLSESVREWPLKRDTPLRPGLTPDDWRRRSAEAAFTVSVGRLAGGQLAAARELSRTPHAVEGPSLVTVPGHEAPAVLWAERRGRGSVLLAAIGGAAPEVVAESTGAILGPRGAVDGAGRLVAVWQQWPAGGEAADGPQIMAATRAATAAGQPAAGWSRPVAVSPAGQPAWAPALAAGPDGTVWCAWDGWDESVYAVYACYASPDGVWHPPVQVSRPTRGHFHIAPDVAAGAGYAWIVWNSTTRWGELNHRFNHIRGIHAAEVTVDEAGSVRFRPAPGGGTLGAPGQVPIPNVPFVHSVEEEFVNPLAPRVRLDADGRPVVFFRQFRSAEFKDFGWSIWATRQSGEAWTPPALVTTHTGFPDTPYGVVPASEKGMAGAGSAGTDSWLLAYHAGDYPRFTDRHPSRPVSRHRLVIERLAPLTPSPSPTRGEGNDNAARFRQTPPRPLWERGPGGEGKPRRIIFGEQAFELLYGDLHRHSAYSKCMSANDGDPLDHWRWVHDVAGLDFYGITEHLEYMSYLEWRRIEDLAERVAAGGRVLALAGWELAIPPGHTNFFYADQRIGQDLRIACLSSPDLAAVWPKLDAWIPAGKAVAIRHMQGHRGDDLAATYSPRWEPVVEIIQTRGEYPDWVQSLWRQGFRVGVIGASDHSRGAPFVQALTGLWVPPEERTREGVLAALHARRSFATNGVRMGVFVSVSSSSGGSVIGMGESGVVSGTPRLRVQATGTAALQTIEFYRDDRLLHLEPVDALEATVDCVDGDVSPGEHRYWVRVVQGAEKNGRRPHRGVAYSSPVWVEVR